MATTKAKGYSSETGEHRYTFRLLHVSLTAGYTIGDCDVRTGYVLTLCEQSDSIVKHSLNSRVQL